MGQEVRGHAARVAAVDTAREPAGGTDRGGAGADRRGDPGAEPHELAAVAVRGGPGRAAPDAGRAARPAAGRPGPALRADLARGRAREPADRLARVGTAPDRALPAVGDD